MKILLFFLVIFTTINSIAQVRPNMNGFVHPKYTVESGTNLTSVNIQRYRGNDTFVITGNTGSWLISQDSGLSWDQPLVFINASNKKILISGGIQSENCQYIKILGFGSDSAYGFEVRRNGTNGNITGVFSGMYKGLMIEGVRFTQGRDGPLWIKSEAPHACDFYNFWHDKGAHDSAMYAPPQKYLAPNFQDSVWVRHCWIDSSGGDTYLGSTGGMNGRVGDGVPCLGGQILGTMRTRNFHFDSNYVNYLGRSGVQLSLANGNTNNTNTINDNIIFNCGYEFPETGSAASRDQGAGVRTGSGDENVEIARNYVKWTNLYNYDIEEGWVNFHHNFGDSPTYVMYHGVPTTNGQPYANIVASAQRTQRGPMIIRSNEMRHTRASASTAIAIYGGANFVLTNNDTCFNIGVVTVLATPFVALSGCTSGPDTIRRDTTVSVIHDTSIIYHVPERIVVIGDTTIFDTVEVINAYIKAKKYFLKARGKFRTIELYDTIPAHDSPGICRLCAMHDSTYVIIILSRKVMATKKESYPFVRFWQRLFDDKIYNI